MNCGMLCRPEYIGAAAAATSAAAVAAATLLLVVRRVTRCVLLQMLMALSGAQKATASPYGVWA
jgi:hypothetical protein